MPPNRDPVIHQRVRTPGLTLLCGLARRAHQGWSASRAHARLDRWKRSGRSAPAPMRQLPLVPDVDAETARHGDALAPERSAGPLHGRDDRRDASLVNGYGSDRH